MYQRYVHQLGLPHNIVKTMTIVKNHTREHLLGIAAKSEIAGILYFVCKFNCLKHPNKYDISKTVGICNPTLNKVIEILNFFYVKNPELKKEIK
jgi:hypothetical protein